jgi:putative flippase GtrA
MSLVEPSAPPRGLRERLAAGDRPLRFLMAGGLNTGFGLAIFPLLLWSSHWLRLHYMVALLIAQGASVLFAFTAYRLALFGVKGDMARQFGLFSSFYLFNYLLNWAALPLLVEVGGVPPIIAQLGFAIVMMVGSYFWHSRVTFRQREAGQ